MNAQNSKTIENTENSEITETENLESSVENSGQVNPETLIKKPDKKTELDFLQTVKRLQEMMIPVRCDMPEAEHYFAPGMYGRKLIIPAGMLVVGKIHKHSHFMMVAKGHALVVSEHDKHEVKAGEIYVSKVGAKRVVFAFEDTVFITVHLNPSNTQDMEVIEREHIEDEKFKKEFHLSANKRAIS